MSSEPLFSVETLFTAGGDGYAEFREDGGQTWNAGIPGAGVQGHSMRAQPGGDPSPLRSAHKDENDDDFVPMKMRVLTSARWKPGALPQRARRRTDCAHAEI